MLCEPNQTLLWKDQSQAAYHKRQFDQPYRSTVQLLEFMRTHIGGNGQALDVGCGAGANVYHLCQVLRGYKWTGIDIAFDTFSQVGKPFFNKIETDATFLSGDFYKLAQIFINKKFDLVLSIQTLSWLPDYEDALKQLFEVTHGWLFISSLFTEFDVDLKIIAKDYCDPITIKVPWHYNIYSLSRFHSICKDYGCKEFIYQDFDIDIDIASTSKGLGTYTQKLDNGKRVQFSGPLFMPWKFVGVKV